MNVTSAPRFVRAAAFLSASLALGAAAVLAPTAAAAQQAAQQPATQPAVARIVAEPAAIEIEAGQVAPVKLTAYDAQGNRLERAPMRVGGNVSGLAMSYDGIKGVRAGKYELVVSSVPADSTQQPVTLKLPVTVRWPKLAKAEMTADSGRLYAGVTLAHRVRGLHADGSARPADALQWRWRSSNEAVASVDRYGHVTAHKPGAVTITAEAEGVAAQTKHTVVASPVTSVAIDLRETSIRTGDVVHLRASARRANGQAVPDVPITWSYTYVPDDTIAAPGATGIIDRGLFVAEVPGRYTILASAGAATARTVVEAKPRDVRRRISVTGRGNVNHVHTSDFWPWTGRDGRDYALMGTWGGDGWAYVWDITDLASPVKSDSVKIDARIINDVTVSPDGRYGVLAREGASDRKNGVVILDLSTPAHPKVVANVTERLTGGVHNTFATSEYLYAISNGDKYVIIDMKDLAAPKIVGEYDHPNSRVHDVWVHDGIAYSSEWGTGVVAVDVGNGKYGGTPEKPVLIATYPTTSGATHEVYPYFQKATGKVYLFLGDEIMSRQGRVWEGTDYMQDLFGDTPKKGGVPQTSAGYTHIVDFTDPKNPKNIAKYHQEEFGAHDIIVEDDVLYQAYYDGGVRIVDVSGELVGNLAEQRREIAIFKPYDPDGFTPNASFVMNAMPWKGHVLFTDFNTGLWSAKLEPREPVVP
jgi:hypothetical protein